MIAGIILAAGKGTRIKVKNKNKVTLPFLNKPLITYGVDLLTTLTDKVVVVVGAFHESVKSILKDYDVIYAYQKKRLGTAHATKIGLEKLTTMSPQPEIVIVAYGDYTMFYKKERIAELINIHKKQKAVVTFITTIMPDPFGYGRIIRKVNEGVVAIIEDKNASDEQKKIKEINAGFYCLDYKFITKNINKIKKSFESKEYYLTDLIEIALRQNHKVVGVKLPFSEVGIGINRHVELKEIQKLYLEKAK